MAKRRSKVSRQVLDTKVTNSISKFLQLPLELREPIYRMLLTTPWTYTETLQGKITKSGNQQSLSRTTDPMSTGRFNLSLALLRVNRQIYTEAARILYAANEFVVVNIQPNWPQTGETINLVQSYLENVELYTLEFFQSVPTFRGLSQAKVTTPVLTVTISALSETQQIHKGNWVTLNITPEVMPRLFDPLWTYSRTSEPIKDCFLAMDFQNRNPSRHVFLNENVLKIWDQMCGFGEIRFTGNMDQAVSNHLKQTLVSGPFEEHVVSYMEMFQSIAEESYSSNDFATAYFYWYHLQRYWAHHLKLEKLTRRLPYSQRPQTGSAKALNVTAYKMGVSAFGLLKILLRVRNYNLALNIAKSPEDWLNINNDLTWGSEEYKCISSVLSAKFAICCALAFIAQGRHEEGESFIWHGVLYFLEGSNVYAKRTYDDVRKEICNAIDNELIHCGSRCRCDRHERVGLKSRGGSDW